METEKPIWLLIFTDYAHRDYVYCICTLTSIKLQRDGKRHVTLRTSIIVGSSSFSHTYKLQVAVRLVATYILFFLS